MPAPIVETEDYSGRVTLRMPKTMHASYALLAEQEDISLNQLIVSHLSFSLGHQFGAKKSFETKHSLGSQVVTQFYSVSSESKKETKSPHLRVVSDVLWEQPVAANGSNYS